jgi:anthranilate phosphoribosyltransferase
MRTNHTMLVDAIAKLTAGESLSMEEMSDAMDAMMGGSCDSSSMAQFLLGLKAKGETVDEVAGAAAAMRRHMIPIRTRRSGVVDTCGTGGDGSRTFNISTAAALVTAAAGVPVAKHGNRKITSLSGSADVLTALGVGVEAEVAVVERCLDELGICFCFAPQLHPAMKHVAAVRRELATPTIFNLLGPLSNPAGAPYQLLGVGKSSLRSLLAAALSRLQSQRAAVVCGQDGLDEVTLSGATDVSLVTPEGIEQRTWTPEDFGIASSGREALLAETPDESAAVIRRILAGELGPPRDIVVLNAAAAIWVAEAEPDLPRAAKRAAEAIDSGRAGELLEQLAEATRA